MSDKELELSNIAFDIIHFVKKKWLPLLLLVLVGIGIGFYNYSTTEIAYESETILRSSVVPSPVLVNHINELGNYVSTKQYAELAKKLNWNDTAAAHIQKLNIITIYDKEEQNYVLQIDASKDVTKIDECIEKLSSYLSKNEYVAQELVLIRSMLQNEIKQNEAQVELLESIQSKMINGTTNALYADPAALSAQIVTLQNDNLLLDKKLSSLSVFEIIDTIIITKNPSITKSIVSSVIVVLFLGLVVLLLIAFFKSAKA